MFRTNTMKKKMLAGDKTLICWMYLCNSIAAEAIALAGFDGILIDHEHGPGDFLNAISLMQAVNGTPTTSIIRVPWNDTVYIKRALDAGAEGLMIPCINTVEEARAAVAACRYPTDGDRGCAFPLARCSNFGLAAAEYPGTYLDELLVIAQVETPQGVENAAEIAAVDGVDMVFVGPMDLSVSMGLMGQFDNPEFVAMRTKAEEAIKASGKLLGGLATPHDAPPQMFERGYQMIGSGSDVWFVRDGALNNIKKSGRDD